MVRNQKRPSDSSELEHVFLNKIKLSDVLRSIVDRYELCDDDHPDHSYEFLDKLTDKRIRERRQRLNEESLTKPGGSSTPRRTAMPTQTTQDQPPDSGDNVPAVKGGKGKDGKGNTDKEGKGNGITKTSDAAKLKICPYHPLGKCLHNATTKLGECCNLGLHKSSYTNKDLEDPRYRRVKRSMERKETDASDANSEVGSAGSTPPSSPRSQAAPALSE